MIVDDALVTDLDLFRGMLWSNTLEVPNNGLDDDHNGRVDDVIGWDISDQDEDVRPPVQRLADYPHGTYMAAHIAQRIRAHFGEMDDYPIKLLFIKSIADTATNLNMADGYLGLETAVSYKPDVVNLSWSGGIASREARDALVQARTEDIFVVGAVGNFPQSDPAFPASHPAVFAVAGIDSNGHLYRSNYGDEVDIAAPSAGYPEALLAENSPGDIDGVSNATALVTATVALMKYTNPSLSNRQIQLCLKATASPLDSRNPNYPGLLGAGALDSQAAINCAKTRGWYAFDRLESPEGAIGYANRRGAGAKIRHWTISPQRDYAGLTLTPFVQGEPKGSALSIVDSHSGDTIWRGSFQRFPMKSRPSTLPSALSWR
ncbi:hypothetical protein BST95_06875 [Halioglobus japonicus]|uniref:S8 family serine peptidase n=1 Tax=Halioglobus japonicus TaxID=930805 RepID=UPI0009796117|nr:S8 family serine peptidase [Halioglobus japonicus]AQA18004.1 hypothetical protein BST95_06875 [Halioglobus japonicus]